MESYRDTLQAASIAIGITLGIAIGITLVMFGAKSLSSGGVQVTKETYVSGPGGKLIGIAVISLGVFVVYCVWASSHPLITYRPRLIAMIFVLLAFVVLLRFRRYRARKIQERNAPTPHP